MECTYINRGRALVRMCPTKLLEVDLQPVKADQQSVPSWSAFNSRVTTANRVITTRGYYPMMPASPNEANTDYTVMKQVQKMMTRLNQEDVVIMHI